MLKIEKQRSMRRWAALQALVAVACVALVAIVVGMLRKVKTKWPFVTLLFYGFFFMILLVPLLWELFAWVGGSSATFKSWGRWTEAFKYLVTDPKGILSWLVLLGMIAAQACLLIIPIKVTHKRPTSTRAIWPTAVAAGFLYTLLLAGIFMSVFPALWKDAWQDKLSWMVWALLPVNWLVWTIVFWRFAKQADPQSYLRRLVKWLVRGSILELLVAVPSHIIVRNRQVCCANLSTAVGLVTGLAVIFIAFGPGLYYLYRARIDGKKATPSASSQDEPKTE